MSEPPAYRERLVDRRLDALLPVLPAVFLTGPRAIGKTTTALRRVRATARLDVPSEAAVWRSDPDALLAASDEPLLIDEWQNVPEVLPAVKRAVDTDPRPGRFIIAGSAGSDRGPDTWPGTGRLVRLPMRGLTVGEALGARPEPLLSRLSDGEWLSQRSSELSVTDYVRLALVGGFPAVVDAPTPARDVWFTSYVEQVLARDVPSVSAARARTPALRRYLTAAAAVSATATSETTVREAAGVGRDAAESYQRLLTDVGVLDALAPWWSNHLKRLTRLPKTVITDAGLWAALLGLSERGILRDGRLLGRLLETFVICQLWPHVDALPAARMCHLRTEGGRQEVDIVVDLPDGELLAIEIKATASPDKGDVKHLAWLRSQVGERFVGGVLLCTTRRAHEVDDGLWAVPISVLWEG